MHAVVESSSRRIRVHAIRGSLARRFSSPQACMGRRFSITAEAAFKYAATRGGGSWSSADGKAMNAQRMGGGKGKGKGKGKRRQAPPGVPWSEAVTHDEGAGGDQPYGTGPRHRRVDIETKELARDHAVASETLRWHRDGVQQDRVAKDTLLPVPKPMNSDDNWWMNWEAEWDEGWDWEAKWHPHANEQLMPRDDPRRPRGPLVTIRDGGYKSVVACNHSEVAAAIVEAHADPPGEVVWQALCRRAEVVAVSMTPAEVVAVVRCVSERQTGQLRLLWKLAAVVVEKLAAFTADDLVALATAYSKLDAVHHGLLNVTALVLASQEDDRDLTPVLAVEMLAAFAAANYPLPLLIDETKRVLRARSQPDAFGPDLPSGTALVALHSLAKLQALDALIISSLLPAALGAVGPSGPSCSLPTSVGAELLFPAACNASRWVLESLQPLQKLEVADAGGLSGQQAIVQVLEASREALRRVDLRRLRLLRGVAQSGAQSKGPSPLRCVVPCRDEAHPSNRGGNAACFVEGQALLGLAELFVEASTYDGNPGDVELALGLLSGATQGRNVAAWPVDLQVRWLGVAARSLELAASSASVAIAPAQAGVTALLDSLEDQPPHLLVPCAAKLAVLMPSLVVQSAPAVSVARVASGMSVELRPNFFRLSLHEAWAVCDGALRLSVHLKDADEPAAELRAAMDELAALGRAAVSSLPSKLRAERVFRRRPGSPEGVQSTDLCRWCSLLANHELVQNSGLDVGVDDASITGGVREHLWPMLAEEAQQVIAQGEPDQETAELLEAFATEGARRGWSAADAESPLGVVAAAILSEWQRAVARDGELEDPLHEPLPISEEVALRLAAALRGVGLEPPPWPPSQGLLGTE